MDCYLYLYAKIFAKVIASSLYVWMLGTFDKSDCFF